MKSRLLIPLTISLLIIFGALSRFLRTKDLLFFMVDEDIGSFIVKRILIDKRLILIGGDIPGGLHTGPAFYYLSALIMFFSKMNPVGQGIFASLVNVLTIPIIYFVGQKIFSSKTIGLFAAVIYSLSTLIVIHNRTFNTLTLAPLLSLLVYFSLFQIIKKKKLNWVYPLTFAIILTVQSEGSGFSLLFLTVFFWIIYHLPTKNKKTISAILLFFSAHLTVLIFEIRHNFQLTKNLVKFLSLSGTPKIDLLKSISALKLIPNTISRIFLLTGQNDISKQITPCSQYILQNEKKIPLFMIMFSLFVLIFFFLKFLKNKKNFGLQIVGVHLLTMILGLILYNLMLPGYMFEWLFVIFFPGFCFILAYIFLSCWKNKLFRPAIVITVAAFALYNFFLNVNLKNTYGFGIKQKAVKYAISQIGDKDFFLDSIGNCFGFGGYRYLFYLSGAEPTHSYMDAVFGNWFYQAPQTKAPALGVVMVNPADVEQGSFFENYQKYLKKAIEKKHFGEIEVLIVRD